MEPRPYSSRRHAQDRRHFLGREIVEEKQGEYLSMRQRQGRQPAVDLFGVFEAKLHVGRMAVSRYGIVSQWLARRRLQAGIGQSRISRYAIQPRCQAFRVVQRPDAAKNLDPGLLEHVPGIGVIPNNSADEIK